MSEDGGQEKTEVRGQKKKVLGDEFWVLSYERTGKDRCQKSEVRGQKGKRRRAKRQKSEVRGQRSGKDRSRMSEVRCRERTEVRGQGSEKRKAKTGGRGAGDGR